MGWKSVRKGTNRSGALLLPRKTGAGLEKRLKKDLPTCGAGTKSQKRPTPVVGMKSNGKCQFNSTFNNTTFWPGSGVPETYQDISFDQQGPPISLNQNLTFIGTNDPPWYSGGP